MNPAAFDAAGGVKSPFEYARTRDAAPPVGAVPAAPDVPTDGYYDGFFLMGSGRAKAAPTRHVERELLMRFSADPSAPGVAGVAGSGTNQFGAFTLEGPLVLATGELRCARQYPLVKRAAGGGARPARARGKGQRAAAAPHGAAAAGGGGAAAGAAAAGGAPRPGRIRKVPAYLVESVTGKTSDPLRRMGAIVDALKSADKHSFFCQAVDTSLVRDYLTIIPHPMDLGTVEAKLVAGEYALVEDAVKDVELVFNNSMHYNSRGTCSHCLRVYLRWKNSWGVRVPHVPRVVA